MRAEAGDPCRMTPVKGSRSQERWRWRWRPDPGSLSAAKSASERLQSSGPELGNTARSRLADTGSFLWAQTSHRRMWSPVQRRGSARRQG